MASLKGAHCGYQKIEQQHWRYRLGLNQKMSQMRNTSFPGLNRYPSWLWWVCVLAAMPVFAYFLYGGEHLRALTASLSVGVVVSLAITLRDDAQTVFYWLYIVACAGIHALVVLSIKIEWRHFPGTVFTPVAVLDLLAWQALFVSTCRMMNRHSSHCERKF